MGETTASAAEEEAVGGGASSSATKWHSRSGGGGSAEAMRAPSPQRSRRRRATTGENSFVWARVLFRYLETVDDGAALRKAEEVKSVIVFNDCKHKHEVGESSYRTLDEAIYIRVRDAVGERHWAKARKICKQLAANKREQLRHGAKGSNADEAEAGAFEGSDASSLSTLTSSIGWLDQALSSSDEKRSLGTSASVRRKRRSEQPTTSSARPSSPASIEDGKSLSASRLPTIVRAPSSLGAASPMSLNGSRNNLCDMDVDEDACDNFEPDRGDGHGRR